MGLSSKVPIPGPRIDTRTLEERLQATGKIKLEKPTEGDYLAGDYKAQDLTKAEAINMVYNKIMCGNPRPTHISDINCNEIPRADKRILYVVTAVGYIPKPKK